jgi:hypothetical protein
MALFYFGLGPNAKDDARTSLGDYQALRVGVRGCRLRRGDLLPDLH